MRKACFSILAVYLGLTLLSGCSANKYQLNYNGLDPRNSPAGVYQLCDEPALLTGRYSEDVQAQLANAGYALLGSSSFSRASYPTEHAVRYGKDLRACLVWVDEEYSHTNSGSYTRTVVVGHETSTIRDNLGNITGTVTKEITREEEVPYSTRIYDYTAYYFARLAGAEARAIDLQSVPSNSFVK